jgi:glycosyltransferase involved in cell wall biosynthesis
VPKIAALARRVDEVTVLADGAVPGVLPDNCRVRLFRSPTKVGRGLRFEAALAAELARNRPERILAHMCPIYAVLAAPLARLLRVRLLLWYTHWHASPTLRLAEPLVDRVVSVDRRSFPLESKKVTATGHGIDLSEFACVAPEPSDALRVLALGRLSPSKGLDTIVQAVAQVDNTRLRIVGPASSDEERRHRAELVAAAAGLPVSVEEPVPRAELPALFAQTDVLVNNMRAGAPDKVVYEAGAGCLPVLASNPIFADMLEPFPREDADELARRLRAFAGLGPDERARIGRELRDKVAAGHSVDSWAERVLAA